MRDVRGVDEADQPRWRRPVRPSGTDGPRVTVRGGPDGGGTVGGTGADGGIGTHRPGAGRDRLRRHDVLGDEPAAPDRGRRLAAAALAALVAGGVAAAVLQGSWSTVQPPNAERVVVERHEAAVQGTGSSGVLRVRVEDDRAPVTGAVLEAPGLEVVADGPAGSSAARGRSRQLRYRVPDCRSLRLPAVLRLRLDDGRELVRTLGRRAEGLDTAGFVPCPPLALPPPALAVRVRGGTSGATQDGAEGSVQLEVRNGGPALQLLSVTGEVPGVAFVPLVPPNGVLLQPDERIELVLGFEIADCADLRRTGRLVLRAARDGLERELGLTVTADWEAGTLPRLALHEVLGACPR